jgi:hypothetical protein
MLEFYFDVLLNMFLFLTLIRATMVNKHSECMKRQIRNCYGRFASPSSAIAPPPSCQEVRSFSHRRRTAPPTSRMQEVGRSSLRCTAPPSRQKEASSNDSVEMYVVRCTAPPPLRLGTPPPPARLVAPPPPPTHMEEVSSEDSLLSDSLGTMMNARTSKGELIYLNWF